MRSPGFLLAATAAAVLGTGGLAQATTISEFPLSNGAHRPVIIAAAPGGSLWFSEHGASAIGSSTLDGAITETSGLSGATYGIAVAPNGDVWATENPAGVIAQLTAGGALHEYSAGIPHNGQPQQITTGPDGQTMWFTQWTPSKIASVGPTGQITEYGAPNQPWGIAAGPDGNLWFTEYGDPGAIGRFSPSTHAVTEFRTGLTANSKPTAITAGPDGNLWFTETANPGRIGRITPTGTITEYTTGLTPNSSPTSITAGPDGNLWFTEQANPGRIGRITPTGTITEYTTGLTPNSGPTSIVAGADGSLWFTEQSDPGRLGRVTLSAPAATTLAATGVGPTSATIAGTVNPSGAPTTYHFEWGASTDYGQLAPADPATVGSDSADHAVAQTLTGLAPNTTYHYRVVASSAGGTTDGADRTFVTAAPPSTLTATTPLSPTTPSSPAGSPASPPVVGRTAVAGVVSGTVLVRLPGSSRLVPLGSDQTIPLGATVNATHGVVKVTNALDRRGHTQSATVWAGSFSMSQARTNGMTTFKVAGAPACATRRPGAVRTAAASRRAPAKLWSKDNHGRYSTRGRNSVATVRGTIWETVETCAGTRTVVKRGTVSVRVLHHHRTVLVHGGHSYLAKP